VTIKLGVIALATRDHGGTYQYTLSTLQALSHVGDLEIAVYGDPQNSDLIKLGYPIRCFRESRVRQLAALIADRLHIRLPDRFAAQDILLAPIYSLALLHTSKPFAYTLHDVQENHYTENFFWWQRVWRHQVHTQLLARAARIICESRFVKADIIRFFCVPERQIAVMPAPPLRRPFLADTSSDRLQAVRVRLQLPEKFLFYPAQFWVHKNHLRLIEAFAEAVIEVPDLKLVLTGKKRDEYDVVMRAIGKFGLSDKVCHLGYVAQEDLQAIYQLATALIMPSLFESVSIPIYEAFQAGTPVMASDILAIPEQVGDAGLLFDPTSVASIKQAILTMTDDPVAARRLGKRGQDRMAAMTPERYGAQLKDLLVTMR
jgi:glycosyltransferase involved in cell wall biosynthesis